MFLFLFGCVIIFPLFVFCCGLISVAMQPRRKRPTRAQLRASRRLQRELYIKHRAKNLPPMTFLQKLYS